MITEFLNYTIFAMEELRREPSEIVNTRIRQEAEFPLDPNRRFAAMFPAVGNSEAKSLTLLCLSSSPMSEVDLHHQFLERSEMIWRTDGKLQGNYCRATLIPIGLVAEADTLFYGSTEYVISYRLTPAGIKYGQPIAAFLLEQSSHLPLSLLDYFGQTSTGPGNTRPVLNKIGILKYLLEHQGKVRTTDIAETIDLQPALVGKRLRNLRDVGLVNYDSFDTEEDTINYKLLRNANRTVIRTVHTDTALTHEVADLVFRMGTVNRDSVLSILKERHGSAFASLPSLRNRLSHILSGFVDMGICESEKFSKEEKSKARITELGSEIVSNIVVPIERALADDSSLLEAWNRIPWQNYARKTIEKYKFRSGNVNRQSIQYWKDQAFWIVSGNPGITPEDIRTRLEHNPSDPLRILLNEGKIRKEKIGKRMAYYPR